MIMKSNIWEKLQQIANFKMWIRGTDTKTHAEKQYFFDFLIQLYSVYFFSWNFWWHYSLTTSAWKDVLIVSLEIER